ncbi:MAG: GH1 family beta-glucosidase [Gammaproteobacteria bacterium]|jgi:beta-glucosidase|nr:GH1 family beta-glucosidase [Gammaproteobacteria bacterium]
MAKFKDGFVWGTAASSYQIEGGAKDQGRGDSVWDMFCRQPGWVKDGSDGMVACDHLHRYQDDVNMMSDLGIQAYRLSIAWPRILPQGKGQVNQQGLDFYDKLVDALLEKGIDPWITLFHWDFPTALYDQGGWLNRDSSDWFADYAELITDRFSDRVKNWFTLNEPQCYIGLGHHSAEHAPGLKMPFEKVLQVSHNSLLAHGKAVQAMRANAKQSLNIGAAPVGMVTYPTSNDPKLIEAARKATFDISRLDCFSNTWYADPMIKGEYPEDGLALYEQFLPEIRTGDMETIHQPLDMYAANIYSGGALKLNGAVEPEPEPLIGCGRTTMDWNVTPECLYWGPKFYYERYGLPIVVTENGMANCDWVHTNGQVEDAGRIDYVRRHLKSLRQAATDGVDVAGYFYWSIMDNFEWAHGYQQRFGLVHVDYETQKRTPKSSAYWYRDVINSDGDIL